MNEWQDISGAGRWDEVTPILAGWSAERKYRVRTRAGEDFLLRITGVEQRPQKEVEYRRIRRFGELPFPLSRAVEMGECQGGRSLYMLLEWGEGESLETALPRLAPDEQYRLGREAGQFLRALHSLPLSPGEGAEDLVGRRLDKLARYEQGGARVEGDQAALDLVKAQLPLLAARPAVYLHGDFHLGNLIFTPQGRVGIIDFNRQRIGDGWEEFRMVQAFDVPVSIPFSVGQVQGYWQGEPPGPFWQALAAYVAYNSLGAVEWAEAFGPAKVADMQARCRSALADYDGFAQPVPRWYREWKGLPA